MDLFPPLCHFNINIHEMFKKKNQPYFFLLCKEQGENGVEDEK